MIEHTVTVSDGSRLLVFECGSGPDLVALHGIPEDHRSFDPVLDALARHARVILPDLRGFGRSSVAGGCSGVTLELLARDLAETIEQLGLENPVLLGHDLGGYVAMDYAQQQLGPVRALVLLNTTYGKLIPSGSLHLVAFCAPVLGPLLLRLAMPRFATLAFRLGFTDRTRLDPAHVERCRRMLEQEQTRFTLRTLYASIGRRRVDRGLFAPSPPPAPRILDLPSLLLWGEQDWFLDRRLLDWLGHLLPEATVARLPGVGHFPHQEAPERVAEALSAFLSRVLGESGEAAGYRNGARAG